MREHNSKSWGIQTAATATPINLRDVHRHLQLAVEIYQVLSADSGVSETNKDRINISDTSNFAVGDYVWVTDDNSTNGEVRKVSSITTDTYLVADSDLSADYTTAQSAAVYKTVEEYQWMLDHIDAATETAENALGKALTTKTYDFYQDWFEGPWIILPWPPVSTITGVYTTGDDETETTMTSTDYYLDDTSQPGRVLLDDTATWPADLREYLAIRVRMVCGYGGRTDVPMSYRVNMLDLISYWWHLRNGVDDESFRAIMARFHADAVWW